MERTRQRMLTVRETAERLGVVLMTAYSLVWSGRLRGAVKRDGFWRVPERSVSERVKQMASHPRWGRQSKGTGQ